jgi:diguanylate cyclase (GGDEF)-like protein
MGEVQGAGRRDVLGGIASPMLLLAYAVAIPLLIFMLFMAGDLRREIPAAQSERLGLTDVSALDRLLIDVARERSAATCPGAPAAAAVGRDIAAIDVLQARAPFAAAEWKATTAAWTGGPAARRGSVVIGDLIDVFRITADQTKLSYDPEVRGIDMADALTYRLPEAVDAFRHAQATLCGTGPLSAPARIALERDTGRLQVLIPDISEDVQEAIELQPPAAAPPLRIAESGLERSAAAALAAIDRAVTLPDPASRAAATRAASTAGDNAERLMTKLEPSLRSIVDERLVGLHRRLALTLLPSIVAVFAGLFVVAIGVRGRMQSAEMAKLREHQLELRHQATHDALTSLPNRAKFFETLEEAIEAIRVEGGSLALLFIDLDSFKAVNDSYGHAAGDDVLRAAGARLSAICSDAGGRMTARLGGDEFAMLVGDADGARLRKHIGELAARIGRDLATPLPVDHPGDASVSISASIGIAFQDGRTGPRRIASEMLREADAAMYESKAKGRDCASIFSSPESFA